MIIKERMDLKTKFAELKKLSKTCKPLTPPKNTPYKPLQWIQKFQFSGQKEVFSQ